MLRVMLLLLNHMQSCKQLIENILPEEVILLKPEPSASCKMCCSKIQHQLANLKKYWKLHLSPLPPVAYDKGVDGWPHLNYRLAGGKHIIISPKFEIGCLKSRTTVCVLLKVQTQVIFWKKTTKPPYKWSGRQFLFRNKARVIECLKLEGNDKDHQVHLPASCRTT